MLSYRKYSKNCELFVHFKSYLLNLGGNMNFDAVFLRKLEPPCEIGAYYAAIFKDGSV